jgi:hypothetical protein
VPGPATKRTGEPTKPFCQIGEIGRKRTDALIYRRIKQRGAIMLAAIFNAIYRQFLQAALLGISSQRAKR